MNEPPTLDFDFDTMTLAVVEDFDEVEELWPSRPQPVAKLPPLALSASAI